MPRPSVTIAHPLEALLVVVLCFGMAIFGAAAIAVDGFRNTPFTDGAMIEIAVGEIAVGAIALLFLRWRGWSLRELLPRPTWIGCGIGVLLVFVSMWASWFAIAPFYEPGMLEPIRDLRGQARPSLAATVVMSCINGPYEEVFLLSYLLRGLRNRGLSVALGVSLLVRMSYHVYQGPMGVLNVLAFGLVFSLYYIRSGDLWPAAFGHTLWDLSALT